MSPFRLLLLPVLLSLAGCATDSVLVQSREFSQRGRHDLAYRVLEDERARREAAGDEIDAEFAAEHATARQTWLLVQARQEIFDEREDEALVHLSGLLLAQPDHPEALLLRERALEKKALRAAQRGQEALVKGDLQAALVQFATAESIEPGLLLAVEGSAKVKEAYDRLEARAQQQFLEAVRKLPEFRFVEVRWHADNAVTNQPGRGDAQQLRSKAQHELALRALARGKSCQDKGQFGAALIEYRAARLAEPTLPGIDATIAQMEREVQAVQVIERAQMAMRSQRFAAARELLQTARELSELSKERIDALVAETGKREAQRDYDAARDLEILAKKEAALAAFEALAKEWPEGFNDVQARIDGLRSDIDSAAKEWAAGEAAEAKGELKQAVEHFTAVDRFYPNWRDVRARLAALRQRLQAAGS